MSECQKAAEGGRDGRSLCMGKGGGGGRRKRWRRRMEQNPTSAGLPLSKPAFVPDLCFCVSLKTCGSMQQGQSSRPRSGVNQGLLFLSFL